jgi:Tfp pilus assembly protein PilO
MNKMRNLAAATAVAALAILALAWFVLIAPQRSHAADLKVQASTARQSSSSLQAQLAQLKAQAKLLPKQRGILDAIDKQLPSNPALPALVRSLTRAADDSGVTLVSIAPGVPTVVAAQPVAGAAGTARVNTGSSQLASIALALTVEGTYFELEQFQQTLESLTRSYKATTLTFAPGSRSAASKAATNGYTGQLTANITGQVFMTVVRTATAPLPKTGAAVAAPTK